MKTEKSLKRFLKPSYFHCICQTSGKRAFSGQESRGMCWSYLGGIITKMAGWPCWWFQLKGWTWAIAWQKSVGHLRKTELLWVQQTNRQTWFGAIPFASAKFSKSCYFPPHSAFWTIADQIIWAWRPTLCLLPSGDYWLLRWMLLLCCFAVKHKWHLKKKKEGKIAPILIHLTHPCKNFSVLILIVIQNLSVIISEK